MEVTLEVAPAVLCDALAVPLGPEGVNALANVRLAAEFIKDQYRHCKPILALGAGKDLVESAGAGDLALRKAGSRIDSPGRRSAGRRDCSVHRSDRKTPTFRPRNRPAPRVAVANSYRCLCSLAFSRGIIVIQKHLFAALDRQK